MTAESFDPLMVMVTVADAISRLDREGLSQRVAIAQRLMAGLPFAAV